MEKPLTRQDVREIVHEEVEEIFDRKFDEKFDQKFDERIRPFYEYVRDEFRRVDQRFLEIRADIQWLKNSFNQAFGKLDELISMHKDNKQEIFMLSSQTKRLTNKTDDLDRRVTGLEA